MKKICGLLLLAVIAVPAFAKHGGFYVQPQVKFTEGRKFASNWLGAEAGCALSRSISLGAAYYTPAPARGDYPADELPHPRIERTIAYAGAVVSYIRTLDQNVRLTTKLLIGDGYLGVQHPYFDGAHTLYRINRDRFTVIEPSVRLTTSVVDRVEFEFGTGWLQTYGIGDNSRYHNSSVSSIEFVVGVKVRTP